MPLLKDTAKAALPVGLHLATKLASGEKPSVDELKQAGKDLGAHIITSTAQKAGDVMREKAPGGLGDMGATLLQTAAGTLSKKVQGKRPAAPARKPPPAKRRRGRRRGGWR